MTAGNSTTDHRSPTTTSPPPPPSPSRRTALPVEFLGFAKDPGGNTRAGFTTHVTINRKDYGINWNKALDEGGFMLSDDVDITVNLETVKRAAAPAAPAAK